MWRWLIAADNIDALMLVGSAGNSLATAVRGRMAGKAAERPMAVVAVRKLRLSIVLHPDPDINSEANENPDHPNRRLPDSPGLERQLAMQDLVK